MGSRPTIIPGRTFSMSVFGRFACARKAYHAVRPLKVRARCATLTGRLRREAPRSGNSARRQWRRPMTTHNKRYSLRICREHLLNEPSELYALSFGGRRAVLHEGVKVLAPQINRRLRRARAAMVAISYERSGRQTFAATPRFFTSGDKRIIVDTKLREDTRGFFEALSECVSPPDRRYSDCGLFTWHLAWNIIVLETDIKLK